MKILAMAFSLTIECEIKESPKGNDYLCLVSSPGSQQLVPA